MQAWGLGERKKQQPFPEHCRAMENQEGVSAPLASCG